MAQLSGWIILLTFDVHVQTCRTSFPSIEGRGKYTFPDGHVYEGEFKDGQ